MAKRRSLVEILQHPLNDQEERLADEHVRRERDRINASWSERERESRIVGPTGRWTPMTLTWIGE